MRQNQNDSPAACTVTATGVLIEQVGLPLDGLGGGACIRQVPDISSLGNDNAEFPRRKNPQTYFCPKLFFPTSSIAKNTKKQLQSADPACEGQYDIV